MPVKQRVAILKSRLYRGGVAQVLGEMIKILNEKNIIPDILTLKSDLSENDFEKLYQLKIKFKIKFIGPNLKMPYEWHFLYFNLLSRKYAKNYDLFINSNNTSFLASKKIKTITYIHYPRKERVFSKCASIHIPEKENKSFFDFSQDPFYLAKILYGFNNSFGNNETLIANSNFTASKIQESYSKNKNTISVIYPPVGNEKINQSEKKKQVVTLGRISYEKRQLEQIDIALKNPEIPFYILGFTNFDEYYKKCKEKIELNNAKHIHLLPNLSRDEINTILNESKVFLHNVRNEPFGIGIVQAAEAGCIPVVHGSGGAKEIVNDFNLEFTTIAEAESIINKTIKGEFSFTFTNIYNREKFRFKFIELLNSIL